MFIQSRDLQDFIPLINQLITKYKDRMVSIIQEIFLPVCQTIIQCINQPFDPNDMEVRTIKFVLYVMILIFLFYVRNKEIG